MKRSFDWLINNIQISGLHYNWNGINGSRLQFINLVRYSTDYFLKLMKKDQKWQFSTSTS